MVASNQLQFADSAVRDGDEGDYRGALRVGEACGETVPSCISTAAGAAGKQRQISSGEAAAEAVAVAVAAAQRQEQSWQRQPQPPVGDLQ